MSDLHPDVACLENRRTLPEMDARLRRALQNHADDADSAECLESFFTYYTQPKGVSDAEQALANLGVMQEVMANLVSTLLRKKVVTVDEAYGILTSLSAG